MFDDIFNNVICKMSTHKGTSQNLYNVLMRLHINEKVHINLYSKIFY